MDNNMDRWQSKVAVVTGASAGIGAACVRYLLKNGMIVVGLARRLERMDSMRSELPEEQQKRFHTKRCDVCKEADILQAFASIEIELGGVDVLINNAGIGRESIQLTMPNNSDVLKATMDTNVMGVAYCTREAFQSMKKRGVNGHVVIINSIAGHTVPMVPGMNLNIYAPSKHAITAMTEVLRQEFLLNKTCIKVTSISPGVVDTDIFESKDFVKDNFPMLRAEDIADAVVYCLQTPPGVQIHEMIIKPMGEMF